MYDEARIGLRRLEPCGLTHHLGGEMNRVVERLLDERSYDPARAERRNDEPVARLDERTLGVDEHAVLAD